MKRRIISIFLCILICATVFPVIEAKNISIDKAEYKDEYDERGYTITDSIIAIIWDLKIEENETSFKTLVGGGIRIIEYDSGGVVAFVHPYFLMHVCWSGDFEFDGALTTHFVKGFVRYRVD